MQNIAVVGGQWGDEGKGKIVDLITDRFDIVARFQGGPNAGHSVKFDDKKFSLHHVPSGIFREQVKAVLGNGMVIDLERLLKEMIDLEAAGIELKKRLFISDRAHIILPVHQMMDELRESARGVAKIGTTRLGIGPAYQSKMGRYGIRIIDLRNRQVLKSKIDFLHQDFLRYGASATKEPLLSPEDVCDRSLRIAEKIDEYITDTSDYLNREMKKGSRVLFEGAQGTLLDIDSGTYPYVTSSSSSAAGICAGLGISPTWVHGIIGVFKAYNTRVGEGPFPTEEKGEVGEKLRKLGNEFGTTTGRPRRCGWFDAVAARYSARINNFDCIAFTLLDVLSGFDKIKICTKYRYNKDECDRFPSEPWIIDHAQPVFETIKGWEEPISTVTSLDDLPAKARRYLERVTELMECSISILSVGPQREQSIIFADGVLSQNL